MPKIPQWTRQIPATTVSGPRANPGAMTRDSEAMSQFGAAMSDVGNTFVQKLREAREASQFATAENQWTKGINEFKLGLDKDADYKTYTDRFAAHAKELYTRIAPTITEEKAQVAFKKFADKDTVKEKFNTGRLATQIEIKSMRAGLRQTLDDATKRKDTDFINRAVTAAIHAGYIDADAGETLRLKHIEQVTYTTVWENVLAAPTHDDAMKIIEAAPLNVSEKNSLSAAYIRETDFQKAQKKEALKAEHAAIQTDFITRAYDAKKPLTHAEVDSSTLEATGDGSKAFFHNLIDARTKAVIEGNNLPYTTSNGQTLADLLKKNADPDTPALPSSEILSYVGRPDGISISAAESLIKAADVTGSDVFKNTNAALQAQFGYEGLLKGFGNRPLGSIYYNNTMTAILDDLARTPQKGPDLRKRMNEIAQPYLEDFWKDTGESKEDIAKKLKLMGRPLSPGLNVIPPPEPPPVPRRNPGESIEDYMKRTKQE